MHWSAAALLTTGCAWPIRRMQVKLSIYNTVIVCIPHTKACHTDSAGEIEYPPAVVVHNVRSLPLDHDALSDTPETFGNMLHAKVMQVFWRVRIGAQTPR